MTTQLSDGLTGGLDEITVWEYFTGNGSDLAFTSSHRASSVRSVYSWVAGSTNDWAEKTVTTHYTVTATDSANAVITFESGQAPLAAQKQKNTVTFPALASAQAGDFFYMDDAAGARWGISLDISGEAAEPTHATWTAIAAGKKCHVDVSAATTAAQVAASCVAAFDALTGVTQKIVTTDAEDGTVAFELYTSGNYSGTVGTNTTDGTGECTITQVETTKGATYTMKAEILKNSKNTVGQLNAGF